MDVDSVKEGTQIFILDNGGLLDSGAHLGHILQIDALNCKVVLLLLLLGDEDSLGGVDAFVHLEA